MRTRKNGSQFHYEPDRLVIGGVDFRNGMENYRQGIPPSWQHIKAYWALTRPNLYKTQCNYQVLKASSLQASKQNTFLWCFAGYYCYKDAAESELLCWLHGEPCGENCKNFQSALRQQCYHMLLFATWIYFVRWGRKKQIRSKKKHSSFFKLNAYGRVLWQELPDLQNEPFRAIGFWDLLKGRG